MNVRSSAIEIETLTKIYGKGATALKAVDGITLHVPPGQIIGLLGPNGAGKTTTIKLICGLVTPTAGTVRLNGYDIRRQRSQAVLQLGAVLEGGRNVYWSLSAWQNLIYFGRLKGLSSSEISPRAERLLRDLGLWDVRHAPVGGFSRGMQQKVAVAAALITDPPILLLDEPTIGLDVEAARTVKDWMVGLAYEQHKTVVLTTHQLDMAQELADRVAVVRKGQIIADLPVPELLARFRQESYRIVLGIHSDLRGLELPAGITVSHEDGSTELTASALGERDLYSLLARLGEANLPLRSVSPIEPDLEEVFLRLLREGTAP
ncbi:MAG TPA: ABC transporter ATP-binding protein [Candidatus Dormibacteraeota bacterium]|nr:ABC transporter ATP-binding protein [Candidatus Dormibacteraeota bacterium]